MNSKNITVTEGKFLSKLDKINQNSIEKTVPQAITTALEDVRIRTGIIVRFYPYIDKAKVRLNGSERSIICKILHRFGGDLIDFYTPLAYGVGYDDEVHEKYITPKFSQNVCVLNIHNDDSDEYLILGYFQNEDIVGFNPAKPGNVKIMSVCEDKNEYWIKFGKDGFNYRLPHKPKIQVGDVHDEEGVLDFNYANNEDTYTKEEVDSLLEVYNERINQLEEIVNNLTNPSDTNDDTSDNVDNTDNADNTDDGAD